MISWFEKKRYVSWMVTVFIFFFIFLMSSLQFAPTVAGPMGIRAILYHITVFFLLAFFLFVSVLKRKWKINLILLCLAVVTLYAALDELHQYFVPGRFTSFSDFLLDFNGIIFASLIYFILIEIKNSGS